ncbi:fumarylacetoacetase [Ruixingdingia sedimenti]|uniref:fumarylacetoacetase n=1 Tax=Ruixingdingia sedimenti TaxID=3073604 RepID=A0ABU1F4U9_9RHOB|nr:fumarylacetoacetase [Xinfangfangia sp. LG-4]MDR5651643.1 fumarylacetoacetase [Xinfangfangia sp. LG-4]
MPQTPEIDRSHDPARRSLVASADGHPDFPVQNLPFGVFSTAAAPVPRGGVAIGDMVLDLAALRDAGLAPPEVGAALAAAADAPLNAFFALGAPARRALRLFLSDLLSGGDPARVLPLLVPMDQARMGLPFDIRGYTDFYAGIQHAMNVGRLFRPDNPLLPNYKYVPIGYHGRVSSIRPSGTPVVRPLGQTRPPGAEAPVFGPCARLDYELELGAFVADPNPLGLPVPVGEGFGRIGGFCLLNDWSARDVQVWEYQPLGPFLAKNFATTISPWVVTAEALAPFRVAQDPRPGGDPAPLPHLWDAGDQAHGALDIEVEALILTQAMRAAGAEPALLSRGSLRGMYWTFGQLLAHHASNGCNLETGDLLGSGTISDPDSPGSLLELSRGGQAPVALPGGETRSFVQDGDEIILRARTRPRAGAAGIGFGDCRAVVGPAP